MALKAAALVFALAVTGCSGPFFYHDVIVPTYRQVDPNADKAAAPIPAEGQPR